MNLCPTLARAQPYDSRHAPISPVLSACVLWCEGIIFSKQNDDIKDSNWNGGPFYWPILYCPGNIEKPIIFSKPQVSHKNGIFKISNSNLLCNINEKTGQINIQNALVGFYNIDVEYQVEKISHIVSLYFNICPTFYYSSYTIRD